MTLGMLDRLCSGMKEMTDAMEGNICDAYEDGRSWQTPVLVIQGNVIKELVRIAADVKDGKVKAWELIFKEAR